MANGRVRDLAKRYYIAYGSNLNVQQMQMRCPHAKEECRALVPPLKDVGGRQVACFL